MIVVKLDLKFGGQRKRTRWTAATNIFGTDYPTWSSCRYRPKIEHNLPHSTRTCSCMVNKPNNCMVGIDDEHLIFFVINQRLLRSWDVALNLMTNATTTTGNRQLCRTSGLLLSCGVNFQPSCSWRCLTEKWTSRRTTLVFHKLECNDPWRYYRIMKI